MAKRSADIRTRQDDVPHEPGDIFYSRNYNYLVTGYGRINYYFMLVFQRFRYFVENVLDDAILGANKISHIP